MSGVAGRRRAGLRGWSLLLALLACGLFACPPSSGDDDDLVLPDDDDDDDDDDDTVSADDDDDDFTIPDGLPLGGNLLWQTSDGEVPEQHVRVGLFDLSSLGGAPTEPFGVLISDSGLSSGNTIYTIYIKGEPSSGSLSPLADFGVDAVLYVPFAYVDDNEDSVYGFGELLLGASDTLLVFIEDVVPFPGQLVDLGAGPGWNLLDATYLDTSVLEFIHVPDGTNSSNGPSIRTQLLPDLGGSIPVRAEFSVPEGSVISAWSYHASSAALDPSAALFAVAASNDEANSSALLSWPVEGAPSNGHIALLPAHVVAAAGSSGVASAAELSGALYRGVAYFDDGDQVFTAGGCDTLLALDEGRFLVWLEPSSLSLDTAYRLQRGGQSLGWSLFDESLDAWRPFAVGLDLMAHSVGDDDDSAGDDDDSAGDDDDSAAHNSQIPAECLGDDDDSAGEELVGSGA